MYRPNRQFAGPFRIAVAKLWVHDYEECINLLSKPFHFILSAFNFWS